MAGSELVNYQVALKEQTCKDVMVEELLSIKKNKTWEFTKLPKDNKAIAVIWVLKLKVNPEGKVLKHKPKLVTKGFLHK